MQYKLLNDPMTNEPVCVVRTIGNVKISIPFSDANTDYQEYLKWVAEGNTPEPADEV